MNFSSIIPTLCPEIRKTHVILKLFAEEAISSSPRIFWNIWHIPFQGFDG
jgi:hypothetical protein